MGNEGSWYGAFLWWVMCEMGKRLKKGEQGERQNHRTMKGARGGVKIWVWMSHESILNESKSEIGISRLFLLAVP